MKTFFKTNLIWAFALVTGIGTMSFKMTERLNQTLIWFAVDEEGGIQGQTSPEGCLGEGEICAVAFDEEDVEEGQPPISHVSQGEGIIQDYAERFPTQ